MILSYVILITLSLLLLSILVIGMVKFSDDTIGFSLICLIGLIIIGWLIIGNSNSVNEKSTIIKPDTILIGKTAVIVEYDGLRFEFTNLEEYMKIRDNLVEYELVTLFNMYGGNCGRRLQLRDKKVEIE